MSRRPLIIDTFPINAEFEMLECRLEEMAPDVDYFIAVEADVDHQDHPKPFHITENLHRFARWADKLIVVKATGLPTNADDPDPWARELAQREYVQLGLREIDARVGLQLDDIILHGDVDEICRALHVRNVRPGAGYVTFEQELFCFAVDWKHPDAWGGTVAATLRQVIELGPLPMQKLRDTRNRNTNVMPQSGWHLSWLGGRDAALRKLNSFCHPEIAERTLQGLSSDLYLREGFHVDGRRMTPVDVDSTWPRYIADRRCPTSWFRPCGTDEHEHEADLGRLCAAHPDLVPTDDEWRELVSTVEPMWRDYVTTVSPLDHAAGLSTLAMLRLIVTARKPARILDLGSGLSTAVLASATDARITSVDTNQAWADHTTGFLNRHHLDNVVIQRPTEPSGEFDLIFVDIASGDDRNRWAVNAAEHLAPGGIIVFDDAQNESHRNTYREVAARHGLELYSLQARTLDAIERWAMLAVRPATAPALPPTLPPTACNLAAEYERLCNTPSDIYLHLPRFVELVRATNAQHVIELGTRTGVSTIAWLHALNATGGHLTSIDLDEQPPIGEHDHWTFIRGDDMDPGLFTRCEQADIVFIDTSHHYRHTLAELRRWAGKVRRGGWIVCHDTELATPEGWPADDPVFPVKRAIERFTTETGLEWANVPECYGLGLIKVG